jgi:hypothetical protein
MLGNGFWIVRHGAKNNKKTPPPGTASERFPSSKKVFHHD